MEKKVSNGFMFVLNIYFLFLLRFSSSRCILGQFLSQLGQFVSRFHLSCIIYN